MVKKNHVQKKATAEVLVFEQNMLKKSGHTAMVLFRKKKHVERTNNHPRNMFVWYIGTKKCTKTKSGHTAMLFFPIKNVPK
jgi:hypothetical protein